MAKVKEKKPKGGVKFEQIDYKGNRRYVGSVETAAYVLNDAAASLNISDFNERFIYDVIKIDFNYLALHNMIATISLSALSLKEQEHVGVSSSPICYSVRYL